MGYMNIYTYIIHKKKYFIFIYIIRHIGRLKYIYPRKLQFAAYGQFVLVSLSSSLSLSDSGFDPVKNRIRVLPYICSDI